MLQIIRTERKTFVRGVIEQFSKPTADNEISNTSEDTSCFGRSSMHDDDLTLTVAT
jgi:hypothetical protein